MKDFDGLILFVFCCVVAVAVFMGAKGFIQKAIDSTPSVETTSEKEKMLRDQRRKQEEMMERQKRMMEDHQQRFKDYQQRY